ncbi:MAG TPA: hypothetical protein VKQ05_05350 [Gemmatimonadales bacterium]|nr:hypothetical protein [Gemmatimonadales bacterium]
MGAVIPKPEKATAAPATTKTEHPRGTLFLIGVYGVVFAAAWFAVYFFIYLRRGGVTP